MGKWAKVDCTCPNRGPIVDRSLNHTYPCGHDCGELFGIWPGYLFYMRDLLAGILRPYPDLLRTFESFNKIQYPAEKHEEHLTLSQEESKEWRLELEELLIWNARTSALPYDVDRKWQAYWDEFFKDPWHREDAVSVEEIIRHGVKLCDASMATGNPVDFYW